MTCTLKLTDAWKGHKTDFIARNSENCFLISAIKRLERQLAACTPLETSTPFSLGMASEKTALSIVSLSEVCCIYIVNQKTNEIAPFFLFFSGIEAPKRSHYAPHAKAVMNELDWRVASEEKA